jgi:hypothetical protein
MLQRIFHRALQSDHVARKQEVDDLPPAVLHGLEAEQDALEHRVEMRAHHALREHLRAFRDIQLALLEPHHELELVFGERPQARDVL